LLKHEDVLKEAYGTEIARLSEERPNVFETAGGTSPGGSRAERQKIYQIRLLLTLRKPRSGAWYLQKQAQQRHVPRVTDFEVITQTSSERATAKFILLTKNRHKMDRLHIAPILPYAFSRTTPRF